MNELIKLFIEQLKTLDRNALIRIIVIGLIIIACTLWIKSGQQTKDYREESKNNNAFVLEQLKNCESRLDKCEQGRLQDQEKFNKDKDSITMRLINFNMELQSLKIKVK